MPMKTNNTAMLDRNPIDGISKSVTITMPAADPIRSAAQVLAGWLGLDFEFSVILIYRQPTLNEAVSIPALTMAINSQISTCIIVIKRAKRIINECIPKIKENHPEIKIISQNNSENWVDINLEKSLPLDEMIKTYNKCVAYVVTHNECSGLAQFESLLCGTKIVSTRTFSNHAALLSGNYTHELWEFEKGNEDFIRAIESCIKDYDKNEVKELSLKAYNDKLFFDQMKNDLFLP